MLNLDIQVTIVITPRPTLVSLYVTWGAEDSRQRQNYGYKRKIQAENNSSQDTTLKKLSNNNPTRIPLFCSMVVMCLVSSRTEMKLNFFTFTWEKRNKRRKMHAPVDQQHAVVTLFFLFSKSTYKLCSAVKFSNTFSSSITK